VPAARVVLDPVEAARRRAYFLGVEAPPPESVRAPKRKIVSMIDIAAGRRRR